MQDHLVVIDTNVILSGLQSKNGQSYKVLQGIRKGIVNFAISVPLILEYESILKKHLNRLIFSDEDIDQFIGYLCKVGRPVKLFYLWRPFLKDPYDDHILEVALTANCKYIVTFNTSDFKRAEELGIKSITPYDYLELIGG